MPRSSRIVLPGVPHHVTQRGNRRLRTFFSADDFRRYCDLIGDGCCAAGVTVLSYCLMHNHVHLILVPTCPDGLRRALAGPHQKYSWLINRREGWQGHVWQDRFHSFPMDDAHLLSALRYVVCRTQSGASWARGEVGGVALVERIGADREAWRRPYRN